MMVWVVRTTGRFTYLERQVVNILIRNVVAGRFSSPHSVTTAAVATLSQELDVR